jgi:Cu/Ag efflux protein CusF
MKRIVLVGLVWLASALPVFAQQTVTKSASVTATATIQAIDTTGRLVTLRNEKGEEDTYTVGPSVQRFNELKVGQKVKLTYYESIVLQLRKPGEKANPTSYAAALNRAKSAMPAATIAVQERTTVTVKAVDPAVPSITVTTAEGRTVSHRVEERKNLEGVKPGDRIDVTYTQASVVSIEPGQ